MKCCSRILTLFAVCAVALFMSCSDNNGTSFSPVYDQRTLSRTFEEFVESTAKKAAPMVRGEASVAAPFRPGFEPERAIPGSILSNNTAMVKWKTVYEYGENAHLYYTSGTTTYANGTIVSYVQTLDDWGFPQREMAYFKGALLLVWDYTYDESLYQLTSKIQYARGEDPTDNPDARKSSETYYTWNTHGIGTAQSGVIYDSDGNISDEYKYRVTTVKNSLRGNMGLGLYEYMKVYEEGVLIYESKTSFDADGYPETYSVDENGDGTYEFTAHTEITKTPEGYLDTVVWVNDSTEEKYLKESFSYDEEGLLQRFRSYDVEDDEFVLTSIRTYVWYKNPVNSLMGGIGVSFKSDDEGNPLGEYMTIDWTDDRRLLHYYSAPGDESAMRKDVLEIIRLP
jgi:hypothetical protein